MPVAITLVMKRIDRYIGGTIIRGYVTVLLMLVTVFGVLAFLDQVNDIGDGDYTAGKAFVYVLLTLPGLALDLVPITALLGTLIGLGLLAKNRELVVIRAAGVSATRIGWTVAKPGILLVTIGLAVAQFVVPPLEQTAQIRRGLAVAATGELHTQQGFWFRDESRYLNIGNMLHGQIPIEIYIYEFAQGGQLKTFIHARRADVASKKRWFLSNVVRKTFTDDSRVSTEYLDQLLWFSFVTKEKLDSLLVQPEHLAPSNLYQYVQDLKSRGQSAQRHELALWKIFGMPLATGGMLLLAIFFVLGPLGQASTGARIAVGAGVGFAFYVFAQVVSQLGLMGPLDPRFVALVPPLALAGTGLFLLRRLR